MRGFNALAFSSTINTVYTRLVVEPVETHQQVTLTVRHRFLGKARVSMPLQTWLKNKLPPGWSYPVWLGILDKYLGDIPNTLEKSVQFCDGKSSWARNPHSRFPEEPYITIISAHFAQFQPNDIGWTVRVYSLPSDQKAIIKGYLVKEALPRMRKWLIEQRVTETRIIAQPFCSFVLGRTRDSFQWIWKNTEFTTPQIIEVPVKVVI